MNQRAWTWAVTTSAGTVAGVTTGIDLRDCLSRAMTTPIDEATLVGQALGLDTRVLNRAPANAETSVDIVEPGLWITIRPSLASHDARQFSELEQVELASAQLPRETP